MRKHIDRIWDRVPTPKNFTARICLLGFLPLNGWASAIFEPPLAPDGGYGQVTIYMVAGLVSTDAVVSLPAVLFGNFPVERRAVMTLGVGLLLYNPLPVRPAPGLRPELGPSSEHRRGLHRRHSGQAPACLESRSGHRRGGPDAHQERRPHQGHPPMQGIWLPLVVAFAGGTALGPLVTGLIG